MPTAQELHERARAKRDVATRARRWAAEMIVDADRDRLVCHAAELDAEAAELDRQCELPKVSRGRRLRTPTPGGATSKP